MKPGSTVSIITATTERSTMVWHQAVRMTLCWFIHSVEINRIPVWIPAAVCMWSRTLKAKIYFIFQQDKDPKQKTRAAQDWLSETPGTVQWETMFQSNPSFVYGTDPEHLFMQGHHCNLTKVCTQKKWRNCRVQMCKQIHMCGAHSCEGCRRNFTSGTVWRN